MKCPNCHNIKTLYENRLHPEKLRKWRENYRKIVTTNNVHGGVSYSCEFFKIYISEHDLIFVPHNESVFRLAHQKKLASWPCGNWSSIPSMTTTRIERTPLYVLGEDHKLLIQIDQQSTLFPLLSWPTFHLRGKWGDFVDYRKFVQFMYYFCF